MFSTRLSDLRRSAVCAGGALLFSALCIGGAVAPARASTPATLTQWRANAAQRLDASINTLPATVRRFATRDAEVVADIDATGTLANPRIGRSSGNSAADAALLRKMATLRLAPPPADMPAPRVTLRIALDESGRDTPAPSRLAAR